MRRGSSSELKRGDGGLQCQVENRAVCLHLGSTTGPYDLPGDEFFIWWPEQNSSVETFGRVLLRLETLPGGAAGAKGLPWDALHLPHVAPSEPGDGGCRRRHAGGWVSLSSRQTERTMKPSRFTTNVLKQLSSL